MLKPDRGKNPITGNIRYVHYLTSASFTSELRIVREWDGNPPSHQIRGASWCPVILCNVHLRKKILIWNGLTRPSWRIYKFFLNVSQNPSFEDNKGHDDGRIRRFMGNGRNHQRRAYFSCLFWTHLKSCIVEFFLMGSNLLTPNNLYTKGGTPSIITPILAKKYPLQAPTKSTLLIVMIWKNTDWQLSNCEHCFLLLFPQWQSAQLSKNSDLFLDISLTQSNIENKGTLEDTPNANIYFVDLLRCFKMREIGCQWKIAWFHVSTVSADVKLSTLLF